ncbi:MAG: amidohydrolase/deacetylase family metallohydrolase [Anaerolineae bacterium]
MYDLIIRDGNVVDPSQGLHRRADVAIDGGRIVAVDERVGASARRELDARGLIVTPGLVDLHVHLYKHVSHYGVDPDAACLGTGVTTALDAGSAGRSTWPGLRHFVLTPARMHAYALLHVSAMGMLSDTVGESADLRWLDPASIAITARDNADLILGIKVRLDRNRVGDSGIEPLRRAVAAAEALALPLMAHVGKTPVPLSAITAMMKPGDVITHCFHGWEHGVLDDNGQVITEMRQAAERGILFDVGHGAGSFAFPVAEAALRQGFLPAVISTDLHTYSINGPVYDLPTTMTKFLVMGLSLDEVVRRVTVAPAAAMGLAGEAGSLAPGRAADVTLLQEIEGRFRLDDCFGNYREAPQALVPRWVVLGGEVLPARTAAPWR